MEVFLIGNTKSFFPLANYLLSWLFVASVLTTMAPQRVKPLYAYLVCSLCLGKNVVIFGQLTYIPRFVKISHCLISSIKFLNSIQMLCISLCLDGGKGRLQIFSNLISVRTVVVLMSKC